MKKVVVLFVAVSAIFVLISTSYAVKPPTVAERKDATAKEEKVVDEHCPYGRDVLTKECVKPKEGQFYRDPKTGKMEMKKINKVNLPWN